MIQHHLAFFIASILLMNFAVPSSDARAESVESLREELRQKSDESLAAFQLHLKTRFLMMDLDEMFIERKAPLNILSMHEKIVSLRAEFLKGLGAIQNEFKMPARDYEQLQAKIRKLNALIALASEDQDSLVNTTGSLLTYLSSLEQDYDFQVRDYRQLMTRVSSAKLRKVTSAFLDQLLKRLELMRAMKAELQSADFQLSAELSTIGNRMEAILRANFDESLLTNLEAVSGSIDRIFYVNDLIFEIISEKQKLHLSANAALNRYADLEKTHRAVSAADASYSSLKSRLSAVTGVGPKVMAVAMQELAAFAQEGARYRKKLEASSWEKMRDFQVAMLREMLEFQMMSPQCTSRSQSHIENAGRMTEYVDYHSALPFFSLIVDECLKPKKN